MSKSISVALLLLYVFFCSASNSKFEDWMQLYDVQYDSDQETFKRAEIFSQNLNWIQSHNNNKDNSYKVAINQYADITIEEFRENILLKHQKQEKTQNNFNTNIQYQTPPESWDWRDYGVVTKVKNQGHCSSCWAFATTGVVESFQAIYSKNHSLISLSEQNLMDCSWIEGNKGCGGGNIDNSLNYIIKNNGIDTENYYPYEMATTTQCKYNQTFRGATVSNFSVIQYGNETQLQQIVAFVSPVACLIDGNDPGFQFYSSGVYYNSFCSKWRMNHAILVVGYGVDSNYTPSEYWIGKNSYGTSWGDNGYIKMARNQDNACGIATHSVFPTKL